MEDCTMGTEDDYREAKAFYDQNVKDSTSFTLDEKESIKTEVDRLGEKVHWKRMELMEWMNCKSGSCSSPENAMMGCMMLIFAPIFIFVLLPLWLLTQAGLYWLNNPFTGTVVGCFIIEIIVGAVWMFRKFQPKERGIFVLAVVLLLLCVMILAGAVAIRSVRNLPSLLLPTGILFWIYRKQRQTFQNIFDHFRNLEHKKIVAGIYGVTILLLVICWAI